MIYFQLALFFCTALMSLSFIGYAPARFLLQGDAARFRLHFLPLIGLASVIVLSSFLNYVVSMTTATWAMLAAATLVNTAWVAKTRTLGIPMPDTSGWLVLGLVLVSYVVGVSPLAHAQSTGFLGVQWDLEIYLPLTEYLKRFPMGFGLETYPNPLLETVNSAPVRGGSGWGFSYAEAFQGVLLGWPSFETFRPFLNVVFSLSVPAVYLFCSWGIRLGRWTALLAAGLAGLNGLNLWIASIGLGGHAVTFVMLPMSLAATITLLRAPSTRAAALLALIVAAMLLSFYTGALPLYAAASAALGLTALLRDPRRVQLMKTSLVAVVFMLGLAVVGHLRFLEVVPLYFQHGLTEGWRVSTFTPVKEAFGLSPFSLVREGIELAGSTAIFQPVFSPEDARLAAAVSLCVLGLCALSLRKRDWDRGAFLATCVAFAAWAAFFRWGLDYPYGYFKVLSLGGFLLAAGAASGAAALASLGGERLLSRLWMAAVAAKGVVLAGGLLFLALFAANTATSLGFFWQPDPQSLPEAVWELQSMRTAVPRGAPVYVTGRSGYDPRLAGMVAYFLIDNPVVGNFSTAYGSVKSSRPDAPYDYILLQRNERPEERGLDQRHLVWENEVAALYRRPEKWLASVDLEGVKNPAPLQPHQSFTLQLTPDSWSLNNGKQLYEGVYQGRSQQQQVELSLLTFTEGTASLRFNGVTQKVDFPPGLVSYRTQPLQTPGTLEFSMPDGVGDAWLLGVRLSQPDLPAPFLTAGQNLMVLQPRVEVHGTQAQVSLDYVFAETKGGMLAVSLEVYKRDRDEPLVKPRGFWQLVRGMKESHGKTSFVLDLSSGFCGPSASQLAPSGGVIAGDGAYQAHLAVYYVGEEILRKSLLTFRVSSGRVEDLRVVAGEGYLVQYFSTPREVYALAKFIPVGAEVFVPRLVDPDRSFIQAAASFLRDRVAIVEEPGQRAVLPNYALLPVGDQPDRWGYGNSALLWKNAEAVLYRRTDASPLAFFSFERLPLRLASSSPVKIDVQLNKAVLSFAGQLRAQDMPRTAAQQVAFEVVGIARARASLEIGAGDKRQVVELQPGYFEYVTASRTLAQGATWIITPSATEDVSISSLAVLPARTKESLPTLVYHPDSFFVTLSARQQERTAQLTFELFGVRPDGAALGIDVYSERPCHLVHDGWWATPMTSLPESFTLSLDLSNQTGQFAGASGSPLFTDSQTWPMTDGRFRAFLLAKRGDTFRTIPVFEFTRKDGDITDFMSFPALEMLSFMSP